jgi:hypothetical protein
MRDRRLLALALRDLRRLACGRLPLTMVEWNQRNFGRLSAMQGEAELLPAAQLAASLSLGGEIIRLRRNANRFALGADFARAIDGDYERRQCHGNPRTRPPRSGACRYTAHRRRGTIPVAWAGVDPLRWLLAEAIRQLLRCKGSVMSAETSTMQSATCATVMCSKPNGFPA